MKRITMGLAFAGWLCAGAWARPAVVTFSEGDLARVATGMCAVTPEAGKVGPAHRNSAGTMVYFVVNHREAVLYGTQPGTCNKLDDDVYDIWRDDSGNPSAQKVRKSEGDLILVGREVEMRGRRFDVERSGQYMVTSHGTTSTITAVNEAYRVLKSLDFDAQRIFVRKRALVLVGSNPATGQMEARPLEVVEGRIQEQAPIALGGLPAGLKVLDYSEATDDVLLGGVTPQGATSFVTFNLGSGASATVQPQKLGDNQGLFVDSAQIRALLSGGAAPSAGDPAEKPARKSWLPGR
ncbi:hypothetical protein CVU37_09290 [candidate division BRC1 bacterium HGW-BRC1-1]|jgi:hypothetical protein|nr:MAG: hypothetical protein CVU37_09290 [candidate division BRC1 bacterium HGW-BRC1-1]